MKFNTQDYYDVSVVEMKGELDCEVTDSFIKTISELIASERKGIVLEMNDVTFIDGDGLEKLLWAKDYCDENHSQLRLCGMNSNCGKILELTRLDGEFSSYGELADAVKSFG